MVYYRDNLANISLKAVCQKAENDLESARKAELLTRNEEKTFLRVNTFLENIWLKMEGITQAECDIYEKVKEAFSGEADGLEKQTETVSQTLQNVFDFMEAAFGDSQEMVAFITELNNCASHSGDADKILDQLRVRRFICILTKTASVL